MKVHACVLMTIAIACWLARVSASAQQNAPETPSKNTISFAAACQQLAQQYQVNILGAVYLTGDPP